MTVVTFHYQGRTADGEVFYDSRKGEPFELTLGTHMVMPKLEEGLAGLAAGDRCSIPVGMAYGERDEGAVQTRILKETIEDGEHLEEGMEVMWTSPRNPPQAHSGQDRPRRRPFLRHRLQPSARGRGDRLRRGSALGVLGGGHRVLGLQSAVRGLSAPAPEGRAMPGVRVV